MGRYLEPDLLGFGDGPSVYAYAGSSPLMRVDPRGLASGDFKCEGSREDVKMVGATAQRQCIASVVEGIVTTALLRFGH
jgi:hypothetical protein